MILVHEDVSATRLEVTAPSSESRLETMWLNVTAAGGRSTVIGAIYRPPDGPAAPDIESLQKQLLDISSFGRPWYLLGDTNLDLLQSERSEVAAYRTMLDELELSQLIREPTHPGTRPSLIDHIITNVTDTIVCSK